ncbi:MAG: SDR family oxidoreductase [Opitutus sp.]|nr:SDR family oxidoreductase [Opitutus sp.]
MKSSILPFSSVDRSLRDQVVVITGASSGIGRAAAIAFAREGARLVLAARNTEALQEVAGECATLGCHARSVPTDVADADAVQNLAQQTLDAFGRIDVWINNAGVGLFGPFQRATIEEHRRVVEIDLFGAMNAASAVIPIFLRQKRGTMITNISVGGFVPVPFASAYTAAKFGLRGFMAGLRQELAPHRDIHISCLFPGIIDTPGYQHGANVSGAMLKPTPIMVDPPERVADALVAVARRPRAEVPVGLATRAARLGYGVAPGITEAITGAFFRTYLRRGDPAPFEQGNLFEPSQGRMTPAGGWRQPASSSTHTRALVSAAGAAAVVVAAGWWWRSRQRATSRPIFHPHREKLRERTREFAESAEPIEAVPIH